MFRHVIYFTITLLLLFSVVLSSNHSSSSEVILEKIYTLYGSKIDELVKLGADVHATDPKSPTSDILLNLFNSILNEFKFKLLKDGIDPNEIESLIQNIFSRINQMTNKAEEKTQSKLEELNKEKFSPLKWNKVKELPHQWVQLLRKFLKN